MTTLSQTKPLEEPALGGWWIGACLSFGVLILLGAGTLQQSDKVGRWVGTLIPEFSQREVAAMVDPVIETREAIDSPVLNTEEPSMESLPAPNDSSLGERESNLVVNEPVVQSVGLDEINSTGTDEPAAELLIGPSGQVSAQRTGQSSEQSEALNEALESASLSVEEEAISEYLTVEETDEESDVERSAPAQSLAALRTQALEDMTTRSRSIEFEVGEASLTEASEQAMQQIFEDLFLYAEGQVVVEVASGDAADDISNLVLSAERASVVKNFLILRGLEEQRVVAAATQDADLSESRQYINIEAESK